MHKALSVMPNNNYDTLTLLLVLLISVASGVVGILNKITHGRPYKVAWVASEFIAAILCGFLAYDSYPLLTPHLPSWVGMPLFITVCSYTGGKMLRISEAILTEVVTRGKGKW